MHLVGNEDLSFEVVSRFRQYRVEFRNRFSEVLSTLDYVTDGFVVIDEQLFELFPQETAALSASFPVMRVAPDENLKTLAGVESLSKWLVSSGATSSSTVIAIGGGTVQDLVSFTAHIFHRGVQWAYVPTTLMAQADSCIGSKSGINVLPYKNQIGAVHAPNWVVVCGEFLQSLPLIEMQAGFGEILKLSLTSRHFFFKELVSSPGNLIENFSLISDFVARALLCKKEIVELDEYEADLRRVLNYGHTFGHALEACLDYKIPHGVAVVWGIDVINSLGVLRGLTPLDLKQEIHDFSTEFFDFRISQVPSASELLEQVLLDKKVKGRILHAVFLEQLGVLKVHQVEIGENLRLDLEKVLEEKLVFCSS